MQQRTEQPTKHPTGQPTGHTGWRRWAAGWPAVFAVWLGTAVVFFRGVVFSGFGRLTGGEGDTRLVAYLHEHWLEVAKGNQSWRNPNFFHSVKNVLGLSDTFVLDEVFYAPLRAVGLDRYLALQWTVILLSLLGFVGYYVVCTRLVGIGHWAAIGLTVVASWANNLTVQANHAQMFAVYWLPWVATVIARAWSARTPRAAVGWSVAAGALLGTLTYSTYYVGWFAIFGGIVFGLRMAVHLRDRLAGRPVSALLRAHWQRLAAFVGGFAIPMVPFALTYLPTLESTGGRGFDGVLRGSPELVDGVNVSVDNLLWGHLLQSVRNDARQVHSIEIADAVTPLLMLCVIACAVLVSLRLRHDRSVLAATARSLLTATLVLALVSLRVGDFSLWRGIWTVVPGAKALRAVGRIQLVAAYIAPVAVGAGVAALARAQQLRLDVRAKRLLAAALVLLVVEQCNVNDKASLPHDQQVALLDSITPPPAACRSFFIADVPTENDVELQIDAMIIAQQTGVPTVNGYSGASPGLWDLNPHGDEYLAFVQRWNGRHDVTDTCAYDRTTGVWDTAPFD